MPGSMFIQPSALASLPTSGTAWDRLAARAADVLAAPNLSAADQYQALGIFSAALRWAKDGGGPGKAYVIDQIKLAMGTEAAANDYYPYRALGAYIMAADLVDMPGGEVGANGQTFNAWVQGWPSRVLTGAGTKFNTLYKAARTGPHYYGSFARTSLLTCALWMIRQGINPVGSEGPSTATALRDECIAYIKRWMGDTSVPNTFVTISAFNPAWANSTFPANQGVVNPVMTDATRSGANVVDASYSGAPPLTGGAGQRNHYETLDAVDTALILLINAGYADAPGWANNAVRRNYQFLIDNNLTTPASPGDFNDNQWHQGYFANHLWNMGFPTPDLAVAGQRRLLTTHTDWLTSAGSTWLTTTGSGGGGGGGGGGGAPVITAPSVSFTLNRIDQTVSLDASASAQGSSAILRHTVNWGDGSSSVTLTEPTRTAEHTYAGGQTYTVTVSAVATDGGTATSTQSIQVPNAEGAPIVVFTVDKTLTAPGDPVSYSFAGTTDNATSRMIDWGDGTIIEDAPESGSYAYEDVEDTTSFTVMALAASETIESDPVTKTITVTAASAQKSFFELFVGTDSGPIPVMPSYDSAWDGRHLKLGNYRLWFDSTGTIRYKNGAPVAATDGTPVGSGSGGGGGLLVINAGDPVPPGTPAGTVIFEV